MKSLIPICLILGLVLPQLNGCAVPEKNRMDDGRAVPLYLWLERDIFPEIAERLRTDSFVKGRPFIIVSANGGTLARSLNDHIDALTNEVRSRLVSYLLQYPDIRLVKRYPVSLPNPPYQLAEKRCGYLVEPELLLTLGIKLLDRSHTDLAAVNIRAVDLKNESWVNGFSIHGTVDLTPQQREDLAVIEREVNLKGLKYMPFGENEQDEMAFYLADSLTCRLKEASGGRDLSVFIDASNTTMAGHGTVWLMKKQLLLLNEIQITKQRHDADWILVPEAKNISPHTGLAQLWVEAYERQGKLWIRGVAAYAYFLSDAVRPMDITGKWQIIALPSRKVSGEMDIRRISPDHYQGALLDVNGNPLLKSHILIHMKGQRVDWHYYDDGKHQTVHASGRLLEGNKRMNVRLSTFPSSGGMHNQQLLRKEQTS